MALAIERRNKGFTLIELIATIALLSIIVVISFVSINKVLDQSKTNDCNSLVSSIKSSAKDYVSDNRYNNEFVKKVNNYKVTINADTLTTSNYLTSPIINPYTKEEITASTITINIELYNNYTVKTVTVTAPDVLKECK